MGLIDDITGALLESPHSVSRTQSSDLIRGVLETLGSPQGGGLEGLSRSFEQNGLGDVISSWIGTGQNRPISPDQLSRALGPQQIEQLLQRAGLSGGGGASALATLLPLLIDKLTPDGRVTPKTDLAVLGRSLFAGSATQGGTPMQAVGDKKKPDFSDVQSGSSSTAPPPAAEARTYTVAAGDSLSKISKKLYGDANQWKKIFEANKDKIKNPDLIHPGQVLKIP